MTVQEAVLKLLQNAEMDVNHSGINKLSNHWQKFGGHNRNFVESGKSFPITEDGFCFLPISLL